MKRGVRTLADVPRWTIVRTIRQQSVAEHSYYVALYTNWLCDEIDGMLFHDRPDIDKEQALIHAIWHDMTEIITGDPPGPVKSYMSIDKDAIKEIMYKCVNGEDGRVLTDYWAREPEKAIVKIADYLEMSVFLMEEQRLGNVDADLHLQDILAMLKIKVKEFCPDLWNSIEKHLDSVRSDGSVVARYEALRSAKRSAETV